MKNKSRLLGRLDVKGFTLIELLVVVLIIGILAAVALPQYQKAVEKSRGAQALTLLKSVAQAAESYKLANGSYPTSFDELAIDIPWTGRHVSGVAEYTLDSRANEDWSLELHNDNGHTNNQMFVFRLRGAYAGAGFTQGYIDNSANNTASSQNDEIFCVERASNGSLVFSKQAGDYCIKIMGGTYKDGVVNRYYKLPY